MASSAFLRPGILCTNRMPTIRCGGGESPWLMVRPNRDREVGSVFRFWCCAKNETYSFFRNEHRSEQVTFDFTDAVEKLHVVGSSQGWLAVQDSLGLFLLDPISHERVDLPPLPKWELAHSLVLCDTEEKAFVISNLGHRLAFYSSHGTREWTTLDYGYDSVVYSSTHRRLLCITSATRLEGWDVGGDSPRLDDDWVVQFDWAEPPSTQRQFRYLVCAEEELFMVVRHVNTERHDWYHEDSTLGVEVYKIDRERRRLIKMEESLGGLAMFVGNNDGVAIRDVAGVKPDSVYFASDMNVSIFDCRKGLISPLLPYYFWSYPIWYTCRRHHKY